MRIEAPQLESYFKESKSQKRTFPIFFLIMGEEPYQKMEALESTLMAAKQQGYLERNIHDIVPHFNWETFAESLKMPSLFSEKQIIECRFKDDPKSASLGKGAANLFLNLAKNPPPDTVFFLNAPKFDQNADWVNACSQKGLLISCRKLNLKEFSNWASQKFKQAGFNIQQDALQLFVERTEGNMLHAAQSIEKLKLSFPSNDLTRDLTGNLTDNSTRDLTIDLTLDMIKPWIQQDARFSLFDLVDAVLSFDLKRTKRIFASLRGEEEPILVLWALTREVRTIIPMSLALEQGKSISQVLQSAGVWKNRIPLLTHFLNRCTVTDLQDLLISAQKIDDIIKGYTPSKPDNAWDALYDLCLAFMGVYRARSTPL